MLSKTMLFMRSKINVLMLLMLVTQFAFSQSAKLNPSLFRALRSGEDDTRIVSLFVEGNIPIIQEKIKQLGGTYKYAIKNIASASLPLNKVNELSLSNDITRIEGLYGKGEMMDDMTLINANINPVHSGYAPLTQSYDGKGVVMGFLDSGVDIAHPDFKNADGTTRIKFLLDQYTGNEWTAADIDAGNCDYVEVYGGHGSNVTGIGAGNGLAVNNFIGVAPASDLVIVSVALDDNFLNNIVDGANYIYTKAAAMSEPCVINASLGTYFGSHDGTDLAAIMINDLLEQANGRSFVCAAGNGGNNGINPRFHLGYESQPDSSFTWFNYNNGLGKVFYEWWIDKKDADDFNFAIGADITNPYTFYGRTPYFSLVNDFNFVDGYASITVSLFHNSTLLGDITINAMQYDSTYAVDVAIDPALTTYYWRFITNGTGRFDTWSANVITGTSDMIVNNLPSEDDFPDIARYKMPDYDQTIVSSFSCSDDVITVANYTNRYKYIDFYGVQQVLTTDTTGKLATSSSFGPTRDGRIKPDVAAPGNTTLASGQLIALYALIISQPFKVALGGMHNRNGGTSMASPVVAGIAALYLQKNPQATWKEIKDAIVTTAFEDNFTGSNLPDKKWGYGKVDAFAALITTLVYGCTDPFSINFNPAANVDDGSCEPIVFGCTDLNALNYDPDANMNNGGCVYNVGIDEVTSTDFFSCYPNPAASFTTFYFSKLEESNTSISITDVQGKLLDEIPISANQNHFTYRKQLPPGLYICRLQNNGQVVNSVKLMAY